MNTSYRSIVKRLLECQLNSSYLIDSLILVTKIFYDAKILQGENGAGRITLNALRVNYATSPAVS